MRESDSPGGSASDLAGFEKEDRLAEDLCQVGAVDLVEDEEGRPVLRQSRSLDQPPGPNPEPQAPRLSIRRQPHHEILVRDGGMELDGDTPRPKVVALHPTGQ